MAHHRGRARQGRGVVQLGGLEPARDVSRSGSDRNILILWSNLLKVNISDPDPRGLEYLCLHISLGLHLVGYFNLKNYE